MTADNGAAMRAEFEGWIKPKLGASVRPIDYEPQATGEYWHSGIQARWEAWQEAARRAEVKMAALLQSQVEVTPIENGFAITIPAGMSLRAAAPAATQPQGNKP